MRRYLLALVCACLLIPAAPGHAYVKFACAMTAELPAYHGTERNMFLDGVGKNRCADSRVIRMEVTTALLVRRERAWVPMTRWSTRSKLGPGYVQSTASFTCAKRRLLKPRLWRTIAVARAFIGPKVYFQRDYSPSRRLPC